MQAVVILCQKRALHPLLDALEDWNEDARIVVYGYTPKERDGFIVMHWMQPVPIAFQEKQLKADPGIIEYVVYEVPVAPTETTIM